MNNYVSLEGLQWGMFPDHIEPVLESQFQEGWEVLKHTPYIWIGDRYVPIKVSVIAGGLNEVA